MNKILNNLAELLKVKTIITIMIVSVLCYLAITGKLDSMQFLTVSTMVISFYFGTQSKKQENEITDLKNTKGKEDDKDGN